MSFPTRPVLFALLLALVLGLVAWALLRGGEVFSGGDPLRIATWNMEWLVSPATARQARIACRDGRRATLPCDVARTQARDSADLRVLAKYARRLDADVIAFQEVEDAAIARRVFRGYDICIAGGPGAQHVGFAVRPRLGAQCGPMLESLTAGGRGRPGQLLTLTPARSAPLHLLAVHLKSGCARDPLESSTAACVLLQAQAGALGEWLQQRVRDEEDFIVLGDFNRAGLPEEGDAFWSLLDPSTFEAAASHLPFGNCVFGAPYEAFIDHVLVARTLVPRLHAEGFSQLRFDPANSIRFRLSDHCPVRVSLSLRRIV